jgi:hypothetical protein
MRDPFRQVNTAEIARLRQTENITIEGEQWH